MPFFAFDKVSANGATSEPHVTKNLTSHRMHAEGQRGIVLIMMKARASTGGLIVSERIVLCLATLGTFEPFLGTFGHFEHFCPLLGTLSTFGQIWALFGTLGTFEHFRWNLSLASLAALG